MPPAVLVPSAGQGFGPCKDVGDMDRRVDPIFDERLDGSPGNARAMRLPFLLHGGEDSLRLPEGPG